MLRLFGMVFEIKRGPCSRMFEKGAKENIVVAISGGGRTLSNLMRNENGSFYKVTGVISSNMQCKGNMIAEKAGIPILVETFSKGKVCDKELCERIYKFVENVGAKWIVLGGFLKKFPIDKKWIGHVINIHPALLPKYGGQGMYGIHVHEAVLDAGDAKSGASVHFINDAYDDGALIAQSTVSVRKEDVAEDLADRVFKVECKLLPDVLNGLIKKELPLKNGKVAIFEYDDEQN